ncbi:MAG: FHA domain-containing protein FhaB/FipA [Actinomycetes bacterium]
MSPLALKLIQIGFLVLLWVMVLSVAAVMRSDLFARRWARSTKAGRASRAERKAAVAGAAAGAAAVAGTAGAARVGAGAPAAAAPAGLAGAARDPRPSRPPKPKRGAARELVVTAGTGQGTRIELGASPVTIGRAAENTLVLDDDYVSGRHARLFPHEGAWVVEDLGSTNGTYLGRARLTSPMVVPVGSQVRVGKTVLELRK